MDCNPPGSSVHGILQARILEWIAISFCRESSWPRDWTTSLILLHWQAGSLPWESPGKPGNQIVLQIKNVQPLLIHIGLNSSKLKGLFTAHITAPEASLSRDPWATPFICPSENLLLVPKEEPVGGSIPVPLLKSGSSHNDCSCFTFWPLCPGKASLLGGTTGK